MNNTVNKQPSLKLWQHCKITQKTNVCFLLPLQFQEGKKMMNASFWELWFYWFKRLRNYVNSQGKKVTQQHQLSSTARFILILSTMSAAPLNNLM